MEYSAYEAKAKFSELLRRVGRGQRITVTLHGKKVAEIIPPVAEPTTIESRLKWLEETGQIEPAKGTFDLSPIARVAGGLKRFLEDRD